MFDIALLEVQPFTLSEELNILPGCLFDSKDYSYGDQLLAAGRFWFQHFFQPFLNLLFESHRLFRNLIVINQFNFHLPNQDTATSSQFRLRKCEKVE